MSFKTLATISHVPDRNKWHVEQSLVYQGVINITVPVGFETDLASIPRVFWLIIPHADKHIVEGAIVHDFIYSGKSDVTSRSVADHFLREACKEMGAPPWYYWTVWAAVRAFGWHAWKTDHEATA